MNQHANFTAFVETIAALRAPEGCPWDKAQTHQSIAHNMIEEAYEAAEALEAGDVAAIREELGDVLLQVVLQSQIAQDAGEFTIDDVCGDIDAKIVRRHPHIFGQEAAADAADVQKIWDAIKLQEHACEGTSTACDTPGATAKGEGDAAATQPAGLLDSVPRAMPALMSAQKISRKAAAVGFEWETTDDVWDKVHEEVAEFKAAQTPEEAELEFGDILFTLVNVARKEGIDAESALRASCNKFRNRWAYMEQCARETGTDLDALSMDQLEHLWSQAKKREH